MQKEIENEVWRDVEGYDGMYQVSDLGRVRSLKFGKTRVLKGTKDKDGYLKVGLWKENKKKSFLVHRLVAQAFIENTDSSKTLINHRDEVKHHNFVSNLEYCTASYNMTYNNINLRRKPYIHPTYRRNTIKNLYDPNLTCQQNIEVFKANGIECSERTLWRLRKDLGLTRKYTKRS